MKSVKKWKTYTWILKYLTKLRFVFFLVVLCNIILSLLALVIPKTMQYFTDEIYVGGNIQLIIWMISIVACAQITTVLVRSRFNYWLANLSEQAVQGLHMKLLEQLRSLGIAYTDQKPSGEILSMYHNEVSTIQRLLVSYIPKTLENLFFVLFSFIFLATMNVVLSIVIIPFFLSYYLVGPYFEKKAAIFGRESADKTSALNDRLYNSISSSLELRVVNAEKWDLNRNSQAFDDYINASLRTYFNAYMRGTTRRLTVAFGSIAMFFISAYFVQEGKLSLGEFIAFVFLYFVVIQRLTHLVTNITEQRVIFHQLHRFFAFMNEQPVVRENDNPVALDVIRGNLAFQNVSFHYPGQRQQVIKNLNITIQAGERIAIVGPSGQGKSTLIKLVSRFYDPVEGSLLMDGVDYRKLSLYQLREVIGQVFQETYLFSTSIKENIRFGNSKANDAEVIEAAKAAYAYEFIQALPQGFDTEIGERGYKLSGGQKQRIAIAKMFIKDPPIVLLDEATSSLDNISEQEVQIALEALLKNRTTIIVAHRLSTIKNVDRIIVLKDGGILEEGTYRQLMSKKGYFKNMVSGTSTEVISDQEVVL